MEMNKITLVKMNGFIYLFNLDMFNMFIMFFLSLYCVHIQHWLRLSYITLLKPITDQGKGNGVVVVGGGGGVAVTMHIIEFVGRD